MRRARLRDQAAADEARPFRPAKGEQTDTDSERRYFYNNLPLSILCRATGRFARESAGMSTFNGEAIFSSQKSEL